MKFDKPIALAADHGGYELKEAIKAHLDELGVAYTDFGTDSTASVDYPDFAAKGCKAVQDGSCALVILCCGTGVGMSMCANKMKGITTTPTPSAWAGASWARVWAARSWTPS